jgi:hypothetical protein
VKKKEWRMGDDVVVFCALLPVMGVGAHQGPPPLSVLVALAPMPRQNSGRPQNQELTTILPIVDLV